MTRARAVLVAAALLAGGCSAAEPRPAPTPTVSRAATVSPSVASRPPVSPSPSHRTTATVAAPVYLALGDSLAAGYQPGRGVDAATAYPAIVARGLPGVGLVNLGCLGETSRSFVLGGSRMCSYAAGSQLAQAERVLRADRARVRLVTLDLGGNDLLRCVRFTAVDEGCVERGLAQVREQLPGALRRLRTAIGPGTPIVVLTYYNPFVASGDSAQGRALARRSGPLMSSLNTVITNAARGSDATVADLSTAFRSTDLTPTTYSGRRVTRNVAEICTLTYRCAAYDIHLTDAGARRAARTVLDALAAGRR